MRTKEAKNVRELNVLRWLTLDVPIGERYHHHAMFSVELRVLGNGFEAALQETASGIPRSFEK